MLFMDLVKYTLVKLSSIYSYKFQATNANYLCKDETTQMPKGLLERNVYNPM